MYEGGRPRGFWGFMGSDELLEFEAWGDSDVGRCWPAGAVGLPWGVGEGLCEELFRFEPTRFLKRAFMEVMRLREEEGWERLGGVRSRIFGRGAAADSKLGAVQTEQAASCKLQGCVKESPPTGVRRSPRGIGWAGSWRAGRLCIVKGLTLPMQSTRSTSLLVPGTRRRWLAKWTRRGVKGAQ